MKLLKRDIVYLVISMILVVFAAGTYLLYGRMSTVEVDSSANQAKETATVNPDTEIAEAAVKAFEAALSNETLVAAEDASKQVQDATEKAKFEERIAAGRSKLEAVTAAEEALNKFDETGYYESAEEARLAIMNLEDSEKKNELIERYNASVTELGLETIETSQEGN